MPLPHSVRPPPAWLSKPPPSRCPWPGALPGSPVLSGEAAGGGGGGQGCHSCKVTLFPGQFSLSLQLAKGQRSRGGAPQVWPPRPPSAPPRGGPCSGSAFPLRAQGPGRPPGVLWAWNARCPRPGRGGDRAAKPKPASWGEAAGGGGDRGEGWWGQTPGRRSHCPARPCCDPDPCGPPAPHPRAYLARPLGFISASVPPLLAPPAVLQGPRGCGPQCPRRWRPQWTRSGALPARRRGGSTNSSHPAADLMPGPVAEVGDARRPPAQHPGRYPPPYRARGSGRGAAATRRVTEPSFRPPGCQGEVTAPSYGGLVPSE